ncbi:hypothetical protein Tco_0531748 [Tanacetum coccineum]
MRKNSIENNKLTRTIGLKNHLVAEPPYVPPSNKENAFQVIFNHLSKLERIASHNYPNFQSYPSFSETSLPAAPLPPAHYPLVLNNPTLLLLDQQIIHLRVSTSQVQATEAHKAERFAVRALAFDDVFVAVDYLKKSVELLTNPSASV